MVKKNNITLNNLLKDLKQIANPGKANHLAGFFKTGPGQYGEGDIFLGIIVPESRKIAVKYSDLHLSDISRLIKNKYHEARLIALLILVHKFKTSPLPRQDLCKKVSFAKATADRGKIVDFYLAHTKYINNWDLVDLSAHYIVGNYLFDKNKSILLKLAKSDNLWERRIAIISTFAFIYKGESEWTFKIVKMLMDDEHDLIHKACGWMLREVGKRVSETQLTAFLDIYGTKMPRTMLRYAIERLPEKKRLYYLHK